MVNDTSLTAGIEIHGYVCELLRDRTKNPRDDMLTDLTVAEITEPDGSVRRLTIPEAADFAFLLISAGTETVARLLGWAAVLLDRHPDQRDVLIAGQRALAHAGRRAARSGDPRGLEGPAAHGVGRS